MVKNLAKFSALVTVMQLIFGLCLRILLVNCFG